MLTKPWTEGWLRRWPHSCVRSKIFPGSFECTTQSVASMERRSRVPAPAPAAASTSVLSIPTLTRCVTCFKRYSFAKMFSLIIQENENHWHGPLPAPIKNNRKCCVSKHHLKQQSSLTRLEASLLRAQTGVEIRGWAGSHTGLSQRIWCHARPRGDWEKEM